MCLTLCYIHFAGHAQLDNLELKEDLFVSQYTDSLTLSLTLSLSLSLSLSPSIVSVCDMLMLCYLYTCVCEYVH